MKRAVLCSLLVTVFCLAQTGCGIARHQLYRATNLIKAPLRALTTEASPDEMVPTESAPTMARKDLQAG